jgi:hypothetical protein
MLYILFYSRMRQSKVRRESKKIESQLLSKLCKIVDFQLCRLYLGEDKTKAQVKDGMRREVLQALNELAAENVIRLKEGQNLF